MSVSGTFLTLNEVAKKLNLDPSRVGRFCREGRFENAKQINRIWFIPPSDLKKLVRMPRGKHISREKEKQEKKEILEKILGIVV